MNCEKCGIDAPVHHCDVDGFAYYLCVTCIEDWDAVAERPDTVAPAASGERPVLQ
ncbi:hypothetical protein [Halorubrum sp. Boch-26]|uniref:hypothetical protein n=1 Tax=Halorubrum sp. Boch-26 TaxID=2994426 RepID=UPI002468956A|nr:hypothetical protein [Halorubrum sp. Boch-26]